jgi:sulfur relay (sulfurtransferase) DsrF/TusC family protein
MVHFTDFFDVSEEALEEYGAFNISLINDLPLFIDPFLLFGSEKREYQYLHNLILDYLTFLKSKSESGGLNNAQIKTWYLFPEIKQNWFGYSLIGNGGRGLGEDFGIAMSSNMHIVFDDLGDETISASSHIEKAGLFQIGVGRDNISDFTCNLIKNFLLEYTQNFAVKNLKSHQIKEKMIGKVYFDYKLERWMPKKFKLPFINRDFVVLTPKDILTKDENWINSKDLRGDFESICNTIPNNQLRFEIFNYFRNHLPIKKNDKKPSESERAKAVHETIKAFPEILKYYIKQKEEDKEGAKNVSQQNVEEIETVFVKNVTKLIEQLSSNTSFYEIQSYNSFDESLKRVHFLKDVIENKDGYRLFYVDGKPIKREANLQIIYRLTWYASPFDVNRETNNGRGPVDYAISKGSKDKSLVEFKLASNSKLKMNLQNQVAIYEKANNTDKSLKVILFFNEEEFYKVRRILKELNLEEDNGIILIDARIDNKLSASNVK